MSEYAAIEDTNCFQQFVDVAGELWDCITDWPPFAKDTIGKQLVRAADSVGANMVEGAGRYSYTEQIRFLIIARGSARETRYWIRLAQKRKLFPDERANLLLERWKNASRILNTLINRRRTYLEDNKIREDTEGYTSDIDSLLDP